MAGRLVAAPLAAEARPASKTARIGWLALGPNTAPSVVLFEAFREGLRERGWIDGRNLVIEARWGNRDQARDQAAELVKWQPDSGGDRVSRTRKPPPPRSVTSHRRSRGSRQPGTGLATRGRAPARRS